MGKPTYAQIAKNARVGSATVERVLNGRGGVRQHTVEKVILAARTLDWPGRIPEQHRGIIRLEVILIQADTKFYKRMAKAFRRIASSLDQSIQVHLTFLQENDPKSIADYIENPRVRRSGLIISSPTHLAILDVLEKMQKQGLPIIQLVNKNIAEVEYVGVDHQALGRMAAMMVSRLGAASGTIVAICHSQIHEAHKQRLRGFSRYIEENPVTGLKFKQVYFGYDEHVESARCVNEALQNWPDLSALYNAGGANGPILKELERSKREIFFVGHELTQDTREALKSGIADVILDQVPEAQARRSIDLLLYKVGLLEEKVDNPPIDFITYTAENI